MRIGIDVRCLMEGTRTGVEEYTIGVLKKLFETDKDNEYILFLNSFKKIEGDLSWLEKYPNVETKNYGFPNKLFNLLVWFFGWPKIDMLLGGVDVFFAPNILFISVSKKCRFVLTVHDLSFERFGHFFSTKRKLWHFILNPRSLCERADKILAVSKSTKNDLVSVYGIKKEKIDVVHPIHNIEQFQNGSLNGQSIFSLVKRYGLPEDFILFLGTIEPRKNISSLIKAFERLKEVCSEAKNVKLVIAGSLGWSYEEIIQAAKDNSFKDEVLFTGFVDDKDKPHLYKLARFLIYPSFFEGFGFPPVEAMASGIPVITSNCSSMPEVAGEGAILVDPYRPHEMMLAMKELLEDPELYEHFCKQGTKRAQQLLEISQSENILKHLVEIK
ncbi:MAG: glycosyltransferase family 1 protein [Patescibacteria group bacterium]|nr:glycosyltransferase family 1 protein [Patescibacteria group bacterium]